MKPPTLQKRISLIRYPGGKSDPKFIEEFLGMLPPDITDFHEGFAGGGAVSLAVKRRFGDRVNLWLNDLDQDLMALYVAVRDRCEELCDALELLKATNTVELGKLYEKIVNGLKIHPAIRRYVLTFCLMNGRVNGAGIGIEEFQVSKRFKGFPYDRLHRVSALLQGSKLTCTDYRDVLKKPTQGTCVYLDPPYVSETRCSPRECLYKHRFTEKDHSDLAAAAQKFKGHLILSYDDDDLIWHLYRPSNGFWITPTERHFGFHMVKDGMDTREVGRELQITNFNPQKQGRK